MVDEAFDSSRRSRGHWLREQVEKTDAVDDLPLITIIIPVRNGANVISDCLSSIAVQDYPNFEVLVIDGASIDNTVAIADSYGDRFGMLRCVSAADAGVYDAINKGIELAQGKWIYILGCDDRLANQSVISCVARLLRDYLDFVYGKILRMSSGAVQGERYFEAKIFHSNICQQAIFYRASLFDTLGHFELKYRICADWAFNIRCFGLPCRSTFFDDIIANYDGRGMSSQISDDLFYRDRLSIIKRGYRISYVNSLFRPLRHWFLEAFEIDNAARRWLGAANNLILYTFHALISKSLERINLLRR